MSARLRMKDYKITLQDFLQNNGYSSHYFFQHAKYFLKNNKSINISLYRMKIVLSHKNKKLVIRCHYKNRSRHYITLLTSKSTEIATFKDTISPSLLFKFIADYFHKV